MKSIGESVFYGCTGLTSVIIGKNVIYIGPGAFMGCPNITVFYCKAEGIPETPYNGSGLFEYNIFSSATLHVPSASIESYKSTYPWSEFGNIVALIDDDPSSTGIISSKEDSPYPVGIYSIGGKCLQNEQRGLNIIKMNDGSTKKIIKR